MRVILQFEMRVSAPTKTTTGISLECLGVKVERTAGSVQRAVEDALSVFGHELRKPLLKEARDARAQTFALEFPRTVHEKDTVPEPEEAGGALPEKFAMSPAKAEEMLTGMGMGSGSPIMNPFYPSATIPLFAHPPIYAGDGYISGITKPGEPPEGASAEQDPGLTAAAAEP